MQATYEQVRAAISTDPGFKDRLLRLLTLSDLTRDCVLAAGYRYPAGYFDAVALTSEGERCADYLRDSDPDLSPADIAAIILALFSFQGLLIDVDRCDIEELRNLLSGEVRSLGIRYPFVHYRTLYDRYFDTFGQEHIVLTPSQAQDLLHDTPQGVFQLATYLSGPFGVIESQQQRINRVVRLAPLAHCPDPGCQSIHGVNITTSPTAAGRGYEALMGHMHGSQNPNSALRRLLIDLRSPDDVHFATIHAGQLSWLIGACLSDPELRLLAAAVVDANRPTYRELPVVAQAPELGRTSAEVYVAALDRAALMQLVLMSTDDLIVSELERLVDRSSIVIPATEIRSPLQSVRGESGYWRQRAELSRLGVRFDAPGLGTARLRSFLTSAYGTEELEWMLLDTPGIDLPAKVESLLSSPDVRSVIERFVIGTRSKFDAAREFLRLGLLEPPNNGDRRRELVDRIMWKFGFEVKDYPDLPGLLRRRLSSLKDELKSGIDSTSREEIVRSVAVNLFVSLEEFLDEALAFSSFMLFDDHFGKPRRSRFTFKLEAGREIASNLLSGGTRSAGTPLVLSSGGDSNLFGLIHGFRELALLVQETLADGAQRNSSIRSEETMPRWARHNNHAVFRFQHTVPVFDMDAGASMRIQALLASVTERLVSSNTMGVRNRVPHGGREFPSVDEFTNATAAIEDIVESLETSGLAPLVSYMSGATVDGFGRRRTELVDYVGRTWTLHSPSSAELSDMPNANESQIIAKAALISGCADVLRFRISVDSEFARMWSSFPRVVAGNVDVAEGDEKDSTEVLSPGTTGSPL